MSLSQAKNNQWCIIKDIEIDNFKIQLRLMELGIVVGERVIIKKKSVNKKTLLIAFLNSCFTIKDSVAKGILVEYA